MASETSFAAVRSSPKAIFKARHSVRRSKTREYGHGEVHSIRPIRRLRLQDIQSSLTVSWFCAESLSCMVDWPDWENIFPAVELYLAAPHCKSHTNGSPDIEESLSCGEHDGQERQPPFATISSELNTSAQGVTHILFGRIDQKTRVLTEVWSEYKPLILCGIESLREVYMLSQDPNLLSHRKRVKYRPFGVNLHALRSVVERVELGWSYNLNAEQG
ncbi:hypothetical protein C8J57DRAFT_1473952 [Mycena rebaudengoi]|nr:hypothetical protein C8J57DRAFT_1473952 [Mycena rebaudengoi]